MSGSTLWKVKLDVHQIYNLKLANSSELPDPYIAATLEFPRSSGTVVSTQRTPAKSKTSSGIFNAVLLFTASISDFDFNKVKLVVRVHNGRKITQLFESDGELIGSCTFALSKIFAQAKHWVPREWFPVTSASSPGDCRGYLNLSIGVFGPGDDVPSQLNDFQLLASEGMNEKLTASRSIIEKIVQTPETNFENSMLVFNVLRAESLPILSVRGQAIPSAAYVQVSFVGVKLQTRVVPTNSNPAWNESIRIPVLYPTWDQSVIVEVYSRTNKQETDSSKDVLLGSAIFDFEILYRQGIQPTWFNLYSAGPNAGGFAALFGGDYSGRVQVAANVSRSSDMNASIIPVDTTTLHEPETNEIVLYVDLYELGFLDDAIGQSEIPPEIWIQVQFGPNVFESEHISNCPMSCVFGESLGRLEPIRIHLPRDRSMAYDLILSVCGQSSEKTVICFSRIPLERFLMQTIQSARSEGAAKISGDPEWIRLCRIQSTDNQGILSNLASIFSQSSQQVYAEETLVTVANVLVNIVGFNIPKGAIPERPARVPYQIGSYELRICVHQAANLPIAPGAIARGTLSSTFARVTLAGVSAKTSVIPCSLYPTWNELLRIEADLPIMQTLRPDVLVEIIESSTGAILCSATLKSSGLRPQWTGPPAWYNLSNTSGSKKGVQQKSLLLCATTLVPLADANTYPLPSPVPPRATFSVDLLIVGVRLLRNYSIENLCQIELSWGRVRNRPGKSVVTVRTSDPIAGVGGQFNFLQPALIDIDLPIDSAFQEFLEVRLIERVQQSAAMEAMGSDRGWLNSFSGSSDDLEGGGSGNFKDQAIGFGFIHLNPQYSWISDIERAQYRDTFRMKTVEELRKIDEIRAAAETAKAAKKNRVHSRSKGHGAKKSLNKDLVELQYIEDEIEAHFGISIADENVIELPVDCFNAVETDALLPADMRSTRMLDAKNIKKANTRRAGFSAAGGSGSQEIANLPGSKKSSRFMSEFVWEPTVSKEKAQNARRQIETDLETELDPDQLPFISVPLVAPGGLESGESFIVVGYLKVRCRVREKSGDSSELLQLQQAFMAQFDACRRLMCRLYAIRAEGIVPSQTTESTASASSDQSGGGFLAAAESSSYFLWVRNVAGELIAEFPNCSIKDDGQTDGSRVISLNPEFNKCFQLPCAFPENSVLYVELYERKFSSVAGISLMTSQTTTTVDTLVGSVLIDIENRWFHPDYQLAALGSGEKRTSQLPVETWTLRSADGIPKGKLRFWLEVMDQVTSMGRPIETLPSPQPENLEIRIVLWRTKGVPKPEGEEHCHQGLSVFVQDLPSQDSDTHYGSLDGTGTFNWRFVFKPKVPSEDASVRFQLQHRPLTSIAGIGYTALGEVTLDLASELATVRKTRRGIDLPRCWVPLSHPAFVGKVRGFIEIQIRVLSGEEAKAFPVGLGRESPNTDPFLDGDDPHLVQHRNALANTAIGRSVAKFVEAMKSGIRLATILFIVGLVISGIVGIVVLLAYLGVIKF